MMEIDFLLMFSFRAASGLRCCMQALCRMDSSCGARAQQLPGGIWDLSSPSRDQTQSPTFEGGFLTPGPPGESWEQTS